MKTFFQVAIYVLGFVGLAAITLIPIRSWQLLCKHFTRNASVAHRALSALIMVLACIALVADFNVVKRLFRCLLGEYCGPSIAHGWIFLAMLGVGYLVFEALIAAVSAIARLASRGAT